MFRGRPCDWRRRSLRAIACVGAATALAAGEAKELNKPLSIWEPSLTAKVAGGYKDNVALSEKDAEASAFVRTAVDAAALRLPVDGTQAMFLLMGEDTRYFSSSTVDHEDFAFGQAEVRRFWLNDWQAAASFESVYLDQVVDLSVTETNRTRLQVIGGTLVGRPSARRELSEYWWLGLESPVTRQSFDGLPDDYWVVAPRATIGRTYGHASEVAWYYDFAYRHYDTDPSRQSDPINPTNRITLTNESRVSFQHEVQFGWKHHWDAKQRFRTLTKVSYRVSADQVGNYFDYQRTQISEQLRFREGPWELSAEIRMAWYRFPNQKGTGDINDRERSDLGVTLRAERRFGRHLKLFAEYERAQTLSSLDLEEYRMNTTLGGVEVEF